MRKILLYGYGGAYNHGAEAIVKTSIGVFRQAGIPIYLVTHFPEQDKEFGIDKLADKLIPADFSKIWVEREAIGFEEKEKAAAEIYRDALAEIDGDTICVGIGGDNYCYSNWHRQSLFHHRVKSLGGVSVLWGCSIQPEQMDDRMAEIFLEHDYIYARESLTAEALKKIGVKNLKLARDPAFDLRPEQTAGYEKMGSAVAFNLSPLVLRRSEKLLYFFAETARMMLKKADTLLFLPHVCMPADNDREALKILEELLKPEERSRIVWCPPEYNAAQRKYLISCCEMLICCRTHASIAGYSGNVPTLVVGYSEKSRGIGIDMGMEKWVIPLEEGERLAKDADMLWKERKIVRRKLQEMEDEKKLFCMVSQLKWCGKFE